MLDDGPPFTDHANLLPKLAGDDRFEVAADGLVVDHAAAWGDVAGVRGVAEHFADGVLGPQLAAAAAQALRVEPVREGAIGLGAATVPLVRRGDDRGLLGLVGGVACVLSVRVDEPERETADDVPLRLLLGEAVGDQEGQHGGASRARMGQVGGPHDVPREASGDVVEAPLQI